jgi:hypothetical protein
LSETGRLHYHHTQFYKLHAEKDKNAHPEERLKNNVEENPNFYLYVTDEVNLRLFLSGLMGKENRKTSKLFNTPPTASSNLFLELT